jgi:hypothetical protein
MYRNRRWFFTALSLATVGVLVLAPVAAWADDDKKGDEHHGGATTQQVKHEDHADAHAEDAGPPVVNVQQNNAPVVHENEAVEVENEAAEHANEQAVKAAEKANEAAVEAAEKANEAAAEAAEKANEAAVKAAERAAEAAREAAEEAAVPAAVAPNAALAANLVAAFNNQAAELAALSAMTAATQQPDVDDENEVEVDNEALEIERVQVVNLSTLTAPLTGADLTAVNNAAMADAAGAAAFFNTGSRAAMTLRAQLTNAGFNVNNVLAVLARGEHGVTVVMNA